MVRCLLCVLAVCVSGSAFAAAPTLTYVFPAGGQRGTQVTVTCTGKFDWPVQVDAPGLEVALGEKSGQLVVTIPGDLAADRTWIRFYNPEGASDVVPFLIDSLPELLETEPNNSLKDATVLEAAGNIINGVLKGADTDAFSVPLEAGQTLVAAVDAYTRLGSPIDTILQVALPNGIVVADNHDDLELDPRLSYTAKTTGRYIVRLFGFSSVPNTNIALQGGDNCIYRLTLTTGPYITHTAPLAVSAANPGDVEVCGWNIPAGTRLPVVPLGGSHSETWNEVEPLTDLRGAAGTQLGYVGSPAFAGSARVRLTPYEGSVVPAGQPANIAVQLPHALTGCLREPGQIDQFRIPLKKGETLLVAAEARTLGLLPDPLIRLHGPDGSRLLEVDDTAKTRDASLTRAASVDGEYVLSVTDRHRDGGPRAHYLLTVRADVPDFELTTSAASLVIPVDKPGELSVDVIRRGKVGAITVTAADLPEGVTAEPVVSEEKGDSAKKVTLKLTSAGSPWSGRIRILGTATEPELEREARTPVKLNAAFRSVWLTVIGKPDAQPTAPAAESDQK